MKQFCSAFLIIVVGGVTASDAQIRNLNNNGKRFVEPSAITNSDVTNRNEMARVWAASPVYVPKRSGGIRKTTTEKLTGITLAKGQRLPAIVYLHGCSGLLAGDLDRAKMIAQQGYIVVALASFARSKYAKSCDQKTLKGGFYRGVLKMRQFDIGYAIESLRDVPIVAASKIALVGVSEGGNLAATFKARNAKQRTRVRVIEAWTCHAGWPDWSGMNADRSEHVLSLLGSKDPWFLGKPWLEGDCGRFLNRSNGSKSIVYRSGQLSVQHALLGFKQPRQALFAFLETYLK
nr:dienelactone hydrolase family protein [Leisingera sp. HS039]